MGASYAYGTAGISLFYGYLATVTGEERFADLAGEMLTRAVDSLVEEPSLTIGLFLGVAGVAWTSRHLNLLLSGGVPAGLTEEADEAILETVRLTPWLGDYDLVSGLVGLGFYALDHNNRAFAKDVLNQVVRRLDELALARDGGLTWSTRPELMFAATAAEYPEGYFNLGVAHGVPGIVGMLARACQMDLGGELGRKLLDGAVAWLLAHRRPDDGGSAFTSYFSDSDSGGSAGTACPSGWCYGDAGIASILLCAGQAAGVPAWEREALAIADSDCGRRWLDPEAIGLTLCHGTAGRGHLYNRIYHASGDETFGRSARAWFEATLDLRRPEGALAGYVNWWPESRTWSADPGLLVGAAGVGLALLAAATPLTPDWDSPFLLACQRGVA